MTEVDLALGEVENRIPGLEAEIHCVADDLQTALEIEVRSREAEPLRIRRQVLPSLVEAKERLVSATNAWQEKLQAREAAERHLREAEELYQRTSSVGVIKRLWLKLPKPEEQAEVVASCRTVAAQAQMATEEARQHLAAAEKVEDEVRNLEIKLSAFTGVPQLAKQQEIIARIHEKVGRLDDAYERAIERHTTLQEEKSALGASVSAFRDHYAMDSAEAAEKAAAWFTQLADYRHRLVEITKSRTERELNFKIKLRPLLEALAAWRLVETHHGTAAEMLHLLRGATERARAELAGRTLIDVQTERNRLSAAVAGADSELKAIEERLKRVEEDLIAGARIIATTLTRAYMRNTIQARTFDTVLVDEASMAPIPALWASATLVEQAIVVVGDFRQLPPISQSEHPIAKRWLGRDVFEASGVQGAFERRERIAHFVKLREQHRMHPEISAIVNELIYNKLLRAGTTVKEEKAEEGLRSWYAQPIADFSWFHAKGRGAFVGLALLPWLAQRYPRLSASAAVCNGNAFQSLEQHFRSGGILDPATQRAVMSAEYASQSFLRDLSAARTRVVVYTPTLDLEVVNDVAEALSQLSRNGGSIYNVSRAIAEYSAEKRMSGARAETVLRECGVRIIHKAAMHEKLAILENDLLWCGSSGLFEKPPQGTVMFRRFSRKLVAECAHYLRVDDLIAPYATELHTCPICGLEMLASEAGEGFPFYWR